MTAFIDFKDATADRPYRRCPENNERQQGF
jgi:hypothetical protein